MIKSSKTQMHNASTERKVLAGPCRFQLKLGKKAELGTVSAGRVGLGFIID